MICDGKQTAQAKKVYSKILFDFPEKKMSNFPRNKILVLSKFFSRGQEFKRSENAL